MERCVFCCCQNHLVEVSKKPHAHTHFPPQKTNHSHLFFENILKNALWSSQMRFFVTNCFHQKAKSGGPNYLPGQIVRGGGLHNLGPSGAKQPVTRCLVIPHRWEALDHTIFNMTYLHGIFVFGAQILCGFGDFPGASKNTFSTSDKNLFVRIFYLLAGPQELFFKKVVGTFFFGIGKCVFGRLSPS